ncbi:hypothetical protein BCR35DRAFT_46279 [Leucosporidium creatinivorum]|uniref:Major facilitator superfamily domain-containing protein n=1 Tax=Leucosporidium creatinivorum TaxID=106004 RepID=A0A1Y2C145_9BASI|nr:hypothetical protein BCR35DRAFT_46279 [Leucosporidium creatinivorum]
MASSPTTANVPALADSTYRRKVNWFRSTYSQSVILGITAFLCPGLWGALANLGAGGLATPRTSNTANAALFAIMVFTCLLGAPLTAKVGPRWSLVIGTLGYAPYAAGLYSNSKYGAQWPLILGAVLCGATAGVFWSTEGGIALAYPEESKRAHRLSLWLILNQLGSIVGGSINLALNVNRDQSGSVGLNTYAVFVALQCAGPLIAFLLSEPDKVQRFDGTKVVMSSNYSILKECKAVLKLWATPRVLILTIVFIQCQWSGAATGTYLATYFSVRARALSSLVIAFSAQGLFYLLGYFLDDKRFTLRFRATVSGAFIFVWLTAGWCWLLANQVKYEKQSPAPSFDWVSAGWGKAWFAYVMQNLPSQLLYNWLFWIVSYMTSDGADHIRYVGIMRSAESIAQCLSFGVSATSVALHKSMAVNLALMAVSYYPAYHTVQYVAWRDEQGLNKHEEAKSEVGSPETTSRDDKEL